MPRLIYIASPYTHPDPRIVEWRVKAVALFVSRMIRTDQVLSELVLPLGGQENPRTFFSPILHSHPMAVMIPGDYEAWRHVDEAWMDMSDEMWVLQLPGWKDSKGIKAEIKYWESNKNSVPEGRKFGTDKQYKRACELLSKGGAV